MNLPVLCLIAVLYFIESWLSVKRLRSYLNKSSWFYVWDSLLVVIPLCVLAGFLTAERWSQRLGIAAAAVIGNFAGARTAMPRQT
jgi:hypothetical protein